MMFSVERTPECFAINSDDNFLRLIDKVLIPFENDSSNFSGSVNINTQRKVSWEGMPCGSFKKLSNSLFFATA